jgi:hypothetical protein
MEKFMNWDTDEELEQALRESLRRSAAPPHFTAKVLAKTHQPAGGSRMSWMRRPFALALAAALMAVAIIPAVVLDHQHREAAKGLKAKQDLLMALAITRDQLQHARNEVRKNTRIIQ